MIDEFRPVGIIPARANSSRFPGKILAPLLGKPMIQWVWEAASRATHLSAVWVATDSAEIESAVKGFGGSVIRTSGEFPSGTDRIASVSREWPASIVVNIQGDEPLITAEALDSLVEALESHPGFEMATLAVRSQDSKLLGDPNVVKVVQDRFGRALHFSRHPLASDDKGVFLKHIGIYAYRRDALHRLTNLSPSALERAERLEQLRALENGMNILVVEVGRDTIAVDTFEDVLKVERELAIRHGGGFNGMKEDR